MKTIILVRHAKSTWDYLVEDIDRPLAERGIKDAHRVAQKFRLDMDKIDAIYASPAARALMTSMIFIRELQLPLTHFSCITDIYDFSGESVARFVKGLPNDKNTVMLFGHNHAFTALANRWGSKNIENVPTAGLVQIIFEINDWRSVSKGTTVKTHFPKEL